MKFPELDPEDAEKLRQMDEAQYDYFSTRAHEALRGLIARTGKPQELPEGYHGRWEELSLEDFKFLYGCGIATD